MPKAQVWTSVLERELAARGFPDVDVVNTGLDGTGTDVHARLIREYAARFRPDITLLGESGQLRIEVRPDDASVYVDDEFRGAARDLRQITLGVGRHTLELVRPGFSVERREIEIVKGQRTDLMVELQRP